MTKNLAIYLTNVTPVGQRSYSDMFVDMLSPLMPDTIFTEFNVIAGEFPDDPTRFDGVIITGSSAFVTDDADWITRLFADIRTLDKARTKTLAVCFGHQAVAVALGGAVDFRDVVLGAPNIHVTKPQSWMDPPAQDLRLYGGNFQQVVRAPEDVAVIATHPDCPVAAMVKGDHLLAVQFHPEFSAEYMHSYVDLVANRLSPETEDQARVEIDAGADGEIAAGWFARFFDS